MLILLLLFINNIYTKDPCIYPRYYWINNNAYINDNNWPLIDKNQFVLTENFTQCGVPWIDLYNLDITLIEKEEKILWLLLFQQYCTSSLNIARIEYFLSRLTPEDELLNENIVKYLETQLIMIQEYIIKSVNLLDSYCDKMDDLNFLDAKIYTINILKNLSIVNNGILVGYCDNINYQNNLRLDIYNLFQNTSYIDNSTYNESLFLSYRPINYNTSDIRDQFINGNWVINILINKKLALFLFLTLLLSIFVIFSQTCWYYGNCIKCRKNDNEVKTYPRCIQLNACYWSIKGLFCCLCDVWKRRRKNKDIEEDVYDSGGDGPIMLNDFPETPNSLTYNRTK